MNPELSYIKAQCHRQDLLRAAKAEHRFDAAESRSRRVKTTGSVHLRISSPWRALAVRRAAVGKV